MARWHLATSRRLHERACELSDAAGLAANGERVDGTVFLRTYRKRAIPTTNLVGGETDWTALAGTVVRDGRLGAEALGDVAERLKVAPETAREPLIGHFAIAARVGDTVHIATDEQGSLACYYGERDGAWVISTSLQLVATALGVCRADPLATIDLVIARQNAGPETVFPGVRRLTAAERIEVSVRDGSVRVVPVSMTMHVLPEAAHGDIDAVVAAYAERVRGVFANLRSVGPIGLNATGGLDTRTILAALLDQGIAPRLQYGVGDSVLTNTRPQDLELATELARRLSLPLHVMDWSGGQPHDDATLADYFARFGFGYVTYGSSTQLVRELEAGIDPYPLLHLGGYSPALTNMRPWERPEVSYSLDDIVTQYCHKSGPASLAPEVLAAYRAHVRAASREALDRGPVRVGDEGLSLADFVRARLWLHIAAESANPAYFNEFSYYLAPFLAKQLYDPPLTVPMAYRRGDSFQLRLIEALAPTLLDVPVFSGLLSQQVDRATATMRRADPPRPASRVPRPRGRLRAAARALLPAALVRRLRLARRPFGPPAAPVAKPGRQLSSREIAIREGALRVIAASSFASLFERPEALDTVRLHRAALILRGIDTVTSARSGIDDDPETSEPGTRETQRGR